MTVTLAPPRRTPPPVVRLRPAPRVEPPYDDERTATPGRHGDGRHGRRSDDGRNGWQSDDDRRRWQPEESLDGSTPGDAGRSDDHSRPAAGNGRGDIHSRPAADDGPDDGRGGELWSDPAGAGRRPHPGRGGERTAERTGRAGDGPSEAELAAARFIRYCCEVLGGFRPVRHLSVLIAAEYFAEASERLLRPRRQDTRGPIGGYPSGGPVRRPAAIRTATGPADTVQVRAQRVSEPIDGVAEVSAVFARGAEVWAMALRLERGPAGWLCTYLQVL
jgi:hypothetical protein